MRKNLLILIGLFYLCSSQAQEYTRIEAESASLNNGAFATNTLGEFSGTGYVNGMYNLNAFVIFTIQAPAAGNYTLVFRYASQSNQETTRSMQLLINNSTVSTVNFPTTARWSDWQNHQTTVALNAGSNTVRLLRRSFDPSHVILDYMWFFREANNGPFNKPINIGSQKMFVKRLVKPAGNDVPRFNTFAYTGNRRFVGEETDGRIFEISTNNQGQTTSSLFFDVDAAIRANTGRGLNTASAFHGGLRGLAFHPEFATNGLFYTSVMEDRPLNTAGLTYLSDESTQFVEAEASNTNAVVLSAGSGFTGSGYVGGFNNPGTFVEFVTEISTDGQFGDNIFEVRYAAAPLAGLPNTRKMNVYVNEQFRKTIDFPQTGGWTNWNTVTFELELRARENKISFRYDNPPSGNTGRVNFDNLTLRLPADGVLIEWRYNHSTNQVIQSSYREVFRVGMPVYDHPIKQIGFNPFARSGNINTFSDYGYLYITHGDGSIQSATAGGGQNLNDALGKVLRINPLQSGTSPFSIPNTNPWRNSGSLITRTIYARGFRNPHHISFEDYGSDNRPTIIVADVGRENVEEVNLVRSGGNYGWASLEGTFVHDQVGNTGFIEGIQPLQNGMGYHNFIYPAAQWGHDDPNGRFAIAGGYTHTNTATGAKNYIFGDFPQTGEIYYCNFNDLTSANTRFFSNQSYTSLTQADIFQFEIYFDHDDNPNTAPLVFDNMLDVLRQEPGFGDLERVDFRFGQDEDGIIYIMNKRNGWLYQVQNIQTGAVLGDSGSSNDCTIDVYAGGSTNTETMVLKLDGQIVQSWFNVGGSEQQNVFVKHSYTYSGSFSTIAVELANDNGPRNLQVDEIVVDGVTYNSVNADQKYDAFGGNCNPQNSQLIYCNGGFLWNISGSCSGRFSEETPLTKHKQIAVYPNPANNTVWIENTSDNSKLIVTNLAGVQIDARVLSGTSSKVDISTFESGIYFFSISSNGSNQVFKVVKK